MDYIKIHINNRCSVKKSDIGEWDHGREQRKNSKEKTGMWSSLPVAYSGFICFWRSVGERLWKSYEWDSQPCSIWGTFKRRFRSICGVYA